jgi:hypothetical protein
MFPVVNSILLQIDQVVNFDQYENVISAVNNYFL